MTVFKLRHFTNPDILKAISPKYMHQLLQPYDLYLNQHGMTIGSRIEHTYDCSALAKIFAAPSEDIPATLVDALYHIDDISNAQDVDELLVEVREKGTDLLMTGDVTATEIALMVWLKHPDILEQRCARQLAHKARRYTYFQGADASIQIGIPDRDAVQAIETSLDDWFAGQGRGVGTRIVATERGSEICFIVRHGGLFKREGALANGRSTSVSYRPEQHDIIVYCNETGELKIKSKSPRDRQLYNQILGKALFGSDVHFERRTRYTLDPIKQKGRNALECGCIDGMDQVTLREVQYYSAAHPGRLVTINAADLFDSPSGEAGIPQNADLKSAGFAGLFRGAKRQRAFILELPNIIRFGHDDDELPVRQYFKVQGFICRAGAMKSMA